MRSGSSLRNVDSHALIHEAVLEEAKELTELLARCLSRGNRRRRWSSNAAEGHDCCLDPGPSAAVGHTQKGKARRTESLWPSLF